MIRIILAALGIGAEPGGMCHSEHRHHPNFQGRWAAFDLRDESALRPIRNSMPQTANSLPAGAEGNGSGRRLPAAKLRQRHLRGALACSQSGLPSRHARARHPPWHPLFFSSRISIRRWGRSPCWMVRRSV